MSKLNYNYNWWMNTILKNATAKFLAQDETQIENKHICNPTNLSLKAKAMSFLMIKYASLLSSVSLGVVRSVERMAAVSSSPGTTAPRRYMIW